MASENETVADIGAMLRRFAKGEELPTDDIPSFTLLADRIEAAHKREVAALNELIDDNLRVHKAAERADADTKLELNGEIVRRDTVIAELRECVGSMQAWFRLYFHCDNNPIHPNRSKCTTCRLKRCPCHRWRKALEGASNA